MWLSNTGEKKLKPLDEDVEVNGWDLVTLRIELA
jgi:hypothetical protein